MTNILQGWKQTDRFHLNNIRHHHRLWISSLIFATGVVSISFALYRSVVFQLAMICDC
jgi:hypothetical protein